MTATMPSLNVASSIADSIRCYDDQQSLSPGVPLAVLITSFHAQWKRYHLRCMHYTSDMVIIAVCFHKNCEATLHTLKVFYKIPIF